MENLFVRHKPKRGMVCLTMVGSLLVHGALVGIGSLWTLPQPKDHTVPFDIFDSSGGDPILPIAPLQSSPAETPEATATPDSLDPVATPPPVPDDPVFAEPAEATPPTRRPTAARPSASSNRPTNGQTGSRNPVGVPGTGAPGSGNAASVTGTWVMPHPPYPHMLGNSAVTGQTTVRITTDAAGRVSNVFIVKSTGNPALDNHTSSYVRNNWHGPPNASRTTEFIYKVR